MEAIYPYSFATPVERFGIGKARKNWYNVLFLPDELRAQLPFEQYPRLRVEGEIAEIPVENAFIPAGDGRNYVIVSPEVMDGAELAEGSVAEMRFRIADQDHVDVPEALGDAIERDEAATAAWDKLTPGKRRMIAQHVKSAKTAMTRERRISEALAALINHGGDINAWRRAKR